jgi:hypothetical protein
MGFNRRNMEADRKAKADVEAATRRATDAQVLEDAERLIADWNERQARRMPLLFAPTIGAALAARYPFLWVRCPACRTTHSVDLRTLDRHRHGRDQPHPRAVVPLMPAERGVVRLSPMSIAGEIREEHGRRLRKP